MDEITRTCYNTGIWLFNEGVSIASLLYNIVYTTVLLVVFPWRGLVISLSTGDKQSVIQFLNAVIAEILLAVIGFKMMRAMFPVGKGEKKL